MWKPQKEFELDTSKLNVQHTLIRLARKAVQDFRHYTKTCNSKKIRGGPTADKCWNDETEK
jgi:hypothetical protein